MGVYDVAGMYIARDTNARAASCSVKINGPLGNACGDVLFDTGCTMDFILSEYIALQIGIITETRKSACELGSVSSSGITCR